jgi:hypothetical protein
VATSITLNPTTTSTVNEALAGDANEMYPPTLAYKPIQIGHHKRKFALNSFDATAMRTTNCPRVASPHT